jgi:hypothetical protein
MVTTKKNKERVPHVLEKIGLNRSQSVEYTSGKKRWLREMLRKIMNIYNKRTGKYICERRKEVN